MLWNQYRIGLFFRHGEYVPAFSYNPAIEKEMKDSSYNSLQQMSVQPYYNYLEQTFVCKFLQTYHKTRHLHIRRFPKQVLALVAKE